MQGCMKYFKGYSGVWRLANRGFTLETIQNHVNSYKSVANWEANSENGESKLRIDNLGFV